MRAIQEFKDFLAEYKVMGIAVAFIMGIAVNGLVSSLVNDIIMPLITSFIPEGAWKTATVTLGPFVFSIGSFVSQLLYFGIIVFVIFLITRLYKKGIEHKKPK